MFAYCLLNIRFCSSSLHKNIVERKKKIEDTHKGESKGTKENDCVNHLTRRILDTHALDLDVVVRLGNTTTHGCVGFVETTLVLLSNRFAQQ
jgi:hypothetical protein